MLLVQRRTHLHVCSRYTGWPALSLFHCPSRSPAFCEVGHVATVACLSSSSQPFEMFNRDELSTVFRFGDSLVLICFLLPFALYSILEFVLSKGALYRNVCASMEETHTHSYVKRDFFSLCLVCVSS